MTERSKDYALAVALGLAFTAMLLQGLGALI